MSTAATDAVEAARPVRSGRFALNLVANIGQLGVTMVVGAWYVPFLVRKLGPAVYGLIPLTSMVTSYMGLITLGLESAVARSLSIALEREDQQETNRIVNASFWGNVALCGVLLIPAGIALGLVEHMLRIPPGYVGATRWLFGGTIAAFLLNQIKTPFGVATFCRNRLDLQNLVMIGETLVRVGLVVGLFLLIAPRVEFVGFAILAGTVFSTLSMVWLWRVLTPSLRIQLRQFDWAMLKHLCSTGGWVIVNQLGVMLYLNIDLLLANRLFGAEPSGRYAAVLQLPTLLRSVSFALGGIFIPTMFQIYARGDLDRLSEYLNRAIKFVGLMLALPIGLVCGFAEPLLRLWLGPGFGGMSRLLFLMAIHLCVNLSVYPLYNVPLAANRVRLPGLVTLGIGVGNLLLAWLLAGPCGWGMYGLAGVGALMLSLRNLLFTPLYAAHVLNLPRSTFFRQLGPVAIATASIIGLCRFVLWQWPLSNWAALAVAGLGVSLVYAGLTWLLLAPEERRALRGAVLQSRTQPQP